MMQANLDPDIDEEISDLYEYNRHKMYKKMIKMQNTVRKEDIETAMQDVSFHQRLEDVKTLFPSQMVVVLVYANWYLFTPTAQKRNQKKKKNKKKMKKTATKRLDKLAEITKMYPNSKNRTTLQSNVSD
jgi:hypothetical protein